MNSTNPKDDTIRIKAIGTISGLGAFAKRNEPYIIHSTRLYPCPNKIGVYRCYFTLKNAPTKEGNTSSRKNNPCNTP